MGPRSEEELLGGLSIDTRKPTGAWCRERDKLKGILTLMVEPCPCVGVNNPKNIFLRVDLIKCFICI